MSAIGTKRTCTSAPHMSAFGGKADMTRDVTAWLHNDVAITNSANWHSN